MRQCGRRRGVARARGARALALFLVMLPLGTVACGHTHDELRSELDALRAEVDEMKRGDRSVAMRLDDVESRVLLLQDKVETSRTVLFRDRPAAPLPVVKLRPPEAAPEPAVRVATDTEPLRYDALDAYGRVVEVTDEPLEPPPGADLLIATEAAPFSAPEPKLSKRDELKAAKEYKKAFEAQKRGAYDRAQSMFKRIVERYPSHELADNALYWLGECYYAQKKYLEALQSFQRVIRDYPDGNKVPDAMLKTGLCYQNLGEAGQARRVLRQVAEMYPESPVARVALGRMESIR